MKLYCELCSKTQPVRIDNCRDAKTNEPYQDIVCAECDFVIASGTDITQPKQEPVAWLNITDEGERYINFFNSIKDFSEGTKFYTAPPKREWVGLTEEEIDLYALDIGVTANKAPAWLVVYAKDIEAKLKEKNT